MINIKKRFGIIDMKKEFEETILNNEKQMEELYEEVDKLNNIIKNKDIEIKLLNDKIEMLESIINKNEIKKETITPSKNIPENENNIAEKEINKNSYNVYTQLPTPSISINKKDNINNYNKRPKKVTLNDCLYNYYKNNDNNEECKSTPIINKPKRHRDKSLPAIERYPVKIYEKTNSELLQFVSEENKFKINYQYKISEKINKKIEEITIDEIIDYKIKCEGLKDNKDQRKRLKYKIERCKTLYEKYDEKLGRFKISLNYLSEMPEKSWNSWLLSFDKIVNDLYKQSIICEYKYKNNKFCGKYDCKIKHKPNI